MKEGGRKKQSLEQIRAIVPIATVNYTFLVRENVEFSHDRILFGFRSIEYLDN